MNTAAIISPVLICEPQDCLDLARAGDPEAFGEVCRKYEARLLRQALSLAGDAAAAEELAQETMVEAWKSLKRYNGRCQFFTWLCAILVNRFRKASRQKRRWAWLFPQARAAGDFGNAVENIAATEALPDEAVEARELALELRKNIKRLPEKQQAVIYLRFFVGDSLEAIAAALDCSLGTVKSRLFHALDKLRHMKSLRDPGASGEPGKWL